MCQVGEQVCWIRGKSNLLCTRFRARLAPVPHDRALKSQISGWNRPPVNGERRSAIAAIRILNADHGKLGVLRHRKFDADEPSVKKETVRLTSPRERPGLYMVIAV